MYYLPGRLKNNDFLNSFINNDANSFRATVSEIINMDNKWLGLRSFVFLSTVRGLIWNKHFKISPKQKWIGTKIKQNRFSSIIGWIKIRNEFNE